MGNLKANGALANFSVVWTRMTATKVRRANLGSYSCGGSVEKGTDALPLPRRTVTWIPRGMGGGRKGHQPCTISEALVKPTLKEEGDLSVVETWPPRRQWSKEGSVLMALLHGLI